jgi:solute carrier family 25 (mitochondrial thiamine pyrophosphate transporter), member 19
LDLPSGFAPFACGGLAGCTATVLTYPFDLLRSQLAISRNLYPGAMLQRSRELVKSKYGLKAFYKGLLPATLMIFPYMGINFYLYIKFKRYCEAANHTFPFQLDSLISGGASGIISKAVVFPLEVVKRSFQIRSIDTRNTVFSNLQHSNSNTGIFSFMTLLLRQEGVIAFWKGFTPAICKSAVSSSSSFYVHSLILNLFQNKQE